MAANGVEPLSSIRANFWLKSMMTAIVDRMITMKKKVLTKFRTIYLSNIFK